MPRTTRRAASPWSSPDEREKEREAKREAVLRTAARFFNERGYHATSLDDVAAALNVTKPTIYHYFANKDEILYECTRRGLNEIAEAARRPAEQGGTAADRLRAMLIAYAMTMMDDFGICVARTQDHLLSPESRKGFRALKRDIDGLVRQMIAEGVADGSLSVPDVRVAAFTAGSALNGLGTWFRPDGPVGAAETARMTVSVLIDGMRGRADP
ncbi:TetR/AcrR family transcriptional regulator [Gemmobacter nectariphilus]|uniref:TetR/AcrR family transcriptional regulator n=1 Tax=Gemmobacter nectariphilus TaxID=220343 RepID=UPI000415FD3A|nr:TetR/AcrR family transcriptional regulator [Gemmobacter nectariphilus]